MTHMNCNCSAMDQMVERMREMRRQNPGKETEWVDKLFPEGMPLCCLLTYLLYYGYCEECSVPLSEKARTFLAPLRVDYVQR